MFEHLPSLKSMHAFEAAARLVSFTKAAQEMGLTAGAIGYQVKQLEQELGVLLFERKTRQIVLTDEGQALYRTLNRVLRDLDSEIKHIAPHRTAHKVFVDASTYFAARWLTERLGDFMQKHPRIELILSHGVNDPGFVLRDVDFAIRWGKGDWGSFHAVPLIQVPLVAVCSPNLLLGENRLRSPSDLYAKTLLCDLPNNDFWSEYLRKLGLFADRAQKRRVIADANVRLKSAMDGLGLALSHAPLIKSELSEGRLVTPFQEGLSGFGFYLLRARKTSENPAANSFEAWIIDEAKRFSVSNNLPIQQ